MPETIEAPVIVDEPDLEELVGTDRPWLVIVWNDPVNLMSYVVFVFQKLFGYSREKATKLMLEVHRDGKSVVSHGTREKAEMDVARLHAHGLCDHGARPVLSARLSPARPGRARPPRAPRRRDASCPCASCSAGPRAARSG